jgi:hypothetical protein
VTQNKEAAQFEPEKEERLIIKNQGNKKRNQKIWGFMLVFMENEDFSL